MRAILLFTLILVASISYGQNTYYKNYKVRNFIDFLDDDKNIYDYTTLTDEEKFKVIFLSKEECLSYNDLNKSPLLYDKELKKIDNELKMVSDSIIPSIGFKDCSGNTITVNLSNVNKPEIKDLISVKVISRAKTFGSDNHNKTEYKAGLILKEDKLYVNLWPFKDNPGDTIGDQNTEGVIKNVSNEPNEVKNADDDLNLKESTSLNKSKETRKELFYKLPDDHTAIFRFTEYNINAITIPFKYRPRVNRKALITNENEEMVEINVESEEFSSSFNLAFFGGYSWGKTKFTHRKKVGNRIKTYKHTIGAFLGSSVVELKGTNTNVVLNQPQGDREGTIGTISFGLGWVKSWDKISVGVFSGVDKGVGRVSENWIYDGKLWFGIGVGYDLFKF